MGHFLQQGLVRSLGKGNRVERNITLAVLRQKGLLDMRQDSGFFRTPPWPEVELAISEKEDKVAAARGGAWWKAGQACFQGCRQVCGLAGEGEGLEKGLQPWLGRRSVKRGHWCGG